MYATMEEKIRQQGDHITKLREQQVRPAHVPIPLTPLFVPHDVRNRLELLYEQFKKQNRPVFEGVPDPLKAELWMSMITSIFSFMQDEGNDRVGYAIFMLQENTVFSGRLYPKART
uniref:Uncharacterized protein n=1 Tax=Cannabis sativa TaxID=3483 RepID=A0A803NGD0_CANSA